MTPEAISFAVSCPDSAQANFDGDAGEVKRSGRSHIGPGTSEIRRWLIGRELFAETV